MIKNMPDNMIILDDCLLTLAKLEGFLDQDQLVNFLKSYYDISKYIIKLLIVFQKSWLYLDIQILPFELSPRSEKKSAFIALLMLKKLKNLDNSVLVEEVCMTTLRDKQLTKQRKATPKTKTQMKKTANIEKKIVEKQDKAKTKNQILEIKQLVLSNR